MSTKASSQPSGAVGPSTDDDVEEPLTRDDAFEMLSNRRRRYALHYLKHNGEDATIGDIAEQLAAWENDKSVEAISSSERKTVYTSLQQFHLPKLDDNDVVEYDNRSGKVTLNEAAEDLDIYLEVVDQYDLPWSAYYLGLSGIGIVLVTLAGLGVAPFAVIPFSGWVVFLLASFLVSSTAHFLLSRQMRLGNGDTPPEVTETDA